jgi:hypothetical protein
MYPAGYIARFRRADPPWAGAMPPGRFRQPALPERSPRRARGMLDLVRP